MIIWLRRPGCLSCVVNIEATTPDLRVEATYLNITELLLCFAS